MADEQTTAPSPDGVQRTAEGTIVDQSPSSTTTPSPDSTSTTASETAPDAGKTLLTEGKKDEPPKEPTKGAPDKYDDYKVQEGFTLNPEVKSKADGLFKELGLSQEQAQKAIDLYQQVTADASQAPYKAYQSMTDGWRAEAESHPDLRGKLGPGQEVNVRIAKALDGIGDPKLVSEFKNTMDLTGVGNHPSFIRVLDAFAKRVTEGTHVSGNGPTPAGQSRPGQAPPSAAAALWPNLSK